MPGLTLVRHNGNASKLKPACCKSPSTVKAKSTLVWGCFLLPQHFIAGFRYIQPTTDISQHCLIFSLQNSRPQPAQGSHKGYQTGSAAAWRPAKPLSLTFEPRYGNTVMEIIKSPATQNPILLKSQHHLPTLRVSTSFAGFYRFSHIRYMPKLLQNSFSPPESCELSPNT
ncbi:hypothetical protein AABM17_421 [Neisseria musculi]|uniref:Uncharacterized protein n=1 Tax=Neisseria musculi TaxID=1815583 RepID=A0A7H1MAC5_9NEIS|nr:hypothetical protein H7A79_0421 [Neisseria musculi]